MGRIKFLINGTQRNVYNAEIVREGERAIDISKLILPSNIQVEQNDVVEFLHDIIDLDNLVGAWTFEDHVKDESGNDLDGVGTNITYADNKNNYGRSAVFNGSDSKVSIAHNVLFNFGANEFSMLWRGYFYNEPLFYNNTTTTHSKSIGSDNSLDGDRLGIELLSGNIGIGHSITKISMYLSKTGTPTGNARIGVLDSNDNVKVTADLDVSTLTGSAVKNTITVNKVTLVEGDRIFIEFTGGNASDYINVHGVNEAMPTGFACDEDSPWSDTTFHPAWIFGDNGSVKETLVQKRSGASDGWKLYYKANGAIVFRIGTDEIVGTTGFADGQYHLIYVERRSDNTVELFVDNVSQGTVSSSFDVDTSSALVIGEDYDTTENFSKRCSQYRLYSDVLSSADKTRIHTKTMPVHVMWFGGVVWKTTKSITKKEAEIRSYGKQIGEIEVRGEIFSNTNPETIVQNMVDNNTDLDFVTGVASGLTLQRYVADGKLVDIITDMARLTNRVWTVDARKNFIFEESSAKTVPVTYTHGSNARIFETAEDDSELVNDLIVLGENKRYRSQETFSGDGSTVTFTLTNHPVSTRVVVGGVESIAQNDYIVDIELKQITFTVAPASGTDNILIDYEYEKPLYIRQIRQSSINTHGRRAKRLILPWIREYADGVRFVSSYLNVFSRVNTRMKCEVPTFEHRIKENNVVTFVNAVKSVNSQFLIKSEKWIYPEMITELNGGEFDFNEYEAKKQVLEKIHDLESALTSVKEIQDYEAAEETLGIVDTLNIGLVEEFNETIVITDAFDVTVTLVATYNQAFYSSTATASDDYVYGSV